MSKNPRKEWGVRKSNADDKWHMVQADAETAKYYRAGFCGVLAEGEVYAAFGRAVDVRGSPYVLMDSEDNFCASCRDEALDALGLPDTAEEANERVGREVF